MIGVEAELYPSMKQTLAEEPVSCAGATIAEGIAVKSPGHITREIIRELVDDIVLASEECLERAIDTLITEQKLVVEGAGAADLRLSWPIRNASMAEKSGPCFAAGTSMPVSWHRS